MARKFIWKCSGKAVIFLEISGKILLEIFQLTTLTITASLHMLDVGYKGHSYNRTIIHYTNNN